MITAKKLYCCYKLTETGETQYLYYTLSVKRKDAIDKMVIVNYRPWPTLQKKMGIKVGKVDVTITPHE